MSFSDLKFTQTDFNNQDIASLPDRVTGQASMLKARFDNIGKNMLALGKFNDLCDALDAFITQTVGTSTDKVPSENAVTVALEGKADSEHTHEQSDVTGLTDALSEKVSTGDITQTLGSSTTKIPSEKAVADAISNAGGGDMLKSVYDVSNKAQDIFAYADTKAPAIHTHTQSDVSGLETALNGKANSSHTHAQEDITGLDTALDGKASASHTHAGTDLTSAVPISAGGTGATNAASALFNLFRHTSTATDLNTTTTYGVYYCGDATTNKPSDMNYGLCVAIRVTSSLMAQIGIDYYGRYIWHRSTSDGGSTWTTWYRMYSDRNIVCSTTTPGSYATGTIWLKPIE